MNSLVIWTSKVWSFGRQRTRNINVFIFYKNDRFVKKATMKNRKQNDRFSKKFFI